MTQRAQINIDVYSLETGELFEVTYERPKTGPERASIIQSLRNAGLALLDSPENSEKMGFAYGEPYRPVLPFKSGRLTTWIAGDRHHMKKLANWSSQREAKYGPYTFGNAIFEGERKRVLDFILSTRLRGAPAAQNILLGRYIANMDVSDQGNRQFGRLLHETERQSIKKDGI